MNAATRDYILSRRDHPAADVAAELAADLATARNILTDDLSGYVTGTGLYGPFLLYKAGALTAELEPFRVGFATLDYILSNLRGRVVGGQLVGGFVRTTDPGIAGQMAELLAGLLAAGILTAEEVAGVVALGGGYRYDRLTAEQIEAAWVEEDARAQEQQFRQLLADGYNAAVEAVESGERDPAALAALLTAPLEG